MKKEKIHDDKIILYLAGVVLKMHEAGKAKDEPAVVDAFKQAALIFESDKKFIVRLKKRLFESFRFIEGKLKTEVKADAPPPSVL